MIRAALRIIVPVALLALIWRYLDGAQALGYLAKADPGLIALALVLLHVQIIASALRWRVTAAQLGQPLGRGRALGEYYLAVLANAVLPGGVLGDAGRAVRARGAVGVMASAQAVVIERLMGQILLFAVLVPGLMLWALPGRGPVLAGVAALALVSWAALRWGPEAVRGFGRALWRAWAPVWRTQLGLSVIVLASLLGAFAACSAAVGAPLAPGVAMVLVPLTLVAMLLPISVGGWGLREGAAAVLWPVAGFSAEAGVAASIAFGLAALAAALPGLLVPAFDKRAA